MGNPKFYNGSNTIELIGNEIFFKREELTSYHKGEYDYVTYKIIKFNDIHDAEFIYREMKNLRDQGKNMGCEETTRKIKIAIEKVFREVD